MFDPKVPLLKPRLARGEAIGAAWFTIGDPTLLEIAARYELGTVVIDMQHGLFDRRGLEASIGVLPRDIPALVRTRDDADASIGEALDAGAEGVLVPLVESGAQAERIAHACRYPPAGHRSGGGVRPLADFEAHAAHANDWVLAGVMIETQAGLDAAEEIAGSGVDLVFIGTGDLALSLGVAPGSKAHEAACLRILAACKASGIPCGCFAMDAASAIRRAEQGFALTVAMIDLVLFESGVAAASEAWRARAVKPSRKTRKRGSA